MGLLEGELRGPIFEDFMRYVVAKPVPGGFEYWEISDTLKNIPVVTLHKSVPRAAEEIHRLLDILNASNKPAA